MRSSSSDSHDTPEASRQTVILLLVTMLDTTWRMFVPTLGLAALGLWVDTTQDTGPLWSLVGVFTGIILAALLVRNQFKKVQN